MTEWQVVDDGDDDDHDYDDDDDDDEEIMFDEEPRLPGSSFTRQLEKGTAT